MTGGGGRTGCEPGPIEERPGSPRPAPTGRLPTDPAPFADDRRVPWPGERDDRRAADLLRRLDVEQLVAVEQAAAEAGEPVARFWRDLAVSAETAVTPHSLDALFRDSLRAISRLLGVGTVAILLANETGDELVARAAIGLSEELTLGIGIRAGEGMSGTVLASRRPLVVPDLSEIHVVNPVLRNSGLRSVVAVPLLSDDHPLGVVWAASHDLDRFTAADASLMELLADRLATALDRVRLFERERAARREAERLAGRIGRMQEVTARLAAVGTTEAAAAALVGSLITERADRGPWWAAVWLKEGAALVPAHHDAVPEAPLPPPPAMRVDADHTPARAARLLRPLYLAGPQPPAPTVGHYLTGRPPPSPEADAAALPEEPFSGGALAALPIASGGTCVGVLALAYPGWHPFDVDERAFLEAVVRQASLAFDRARLAAQQDQLAGLSSFFAGAARSLAEAPDLPATLDRLADLALEALGEVCLIDMLDEDGRSIVRMVAKHREEGRQPLVDRLHREFAPDPHGVSPTAEVLRNGVTRWSDKMSPDFLWASTRDPDHFAITQDLGFRSYITVGIISGGEVMGTLTTVSTSRSFGREDVTMAEQLAGQVSALVDTARRFDRAAHTSRVLQGRLLPRRLPHVDGLTVHTRYLPGARALEVGGDFYDLFPLPSGRVAFTIGDVAGHDRAAAALMGHLRTAARALAARTRGPAELVDAVRQSWDLLDFDRIATAVFGLIDPRTGELSLASAGHYPPLLVGAGATPTFVPLGPSPPFGVPGGPATPWRGALEPGQLLLLFTDGAVDERVAGSEQSMAALSNAAGRAAPSPEAVCGEVVRHLAVDRVDDVALLGLRFDGVA